MMLGGSHINPKPIYSPGQTQSAMSQVRGAHRAGSDPQAAMKGMIRPGMSQSEGTFAASLPSMIQGRTAGNAAASNVFMDDLVANQNQMLMASAARDREMRGLGGLALQLYGTDQNRELGSIGNQLGFFNRLMNSGY